MTQNAGCTHSFKFLLKQHEDENYTGRVLQLPAVIASGNSREEVESKIKSATLAYLHAFDETHQLDLDGKLASTLQTPANGYVLDTIPFNVTC